jgi:hypothetical protein
LIENFSILEEYKIVGDLYRNLKFFEEAIENYILSNEINEAVEMIQELVSPSDRQYYTNILEKKKNASIIFFNQIILSIMIH